MVSVISKIYNLLKFNFNNQTVIVTGASKGIGKSVAQSFASSGANVALLSRTLKDLVELENEITNDGGSAMSISTDVSDIDSFQSAVQQIIKKFGTINILVNNAGITRDNLILRLKPDDWDIVMNINLKGCFNGIKAVTKPMIKSREGKIINITSVVGLTGNSGQANYSASKAGILGLTKSAAKELASRSITVNAVAPGYIETEMTASLSKELKEEFIKNIPLNRLGTPQNVADLVMFLASDCAEYITGQVVTVDGGMVM